MKAAKHRYESQQKPLGRIVSWIRTAHVTESQPLVFVMMVKGLASLIHSKVLHHKELLLTMEQMSRERKNKEPRIQPIIVEL